MAKIYGHNEYVKRMKKVNPYIEVVGEYIDSRSKIKFKCLKDGHIWEAVPSQLLIGKKCPKCQKVNRRTKEQYIEELKMFDKNIELVGDFKNMTTKANHLCLICGNEWEVYPYSIIRGHGCKKCADKRISSNNEEYLKFIKDNELDLFPIEPYIKSCIKIMHKCKKCGNEWGAKPNDIKEGKGCPNCKRKSKGEDKISKHLDSLCNVKYEREYTFDDLIGTNGGKLRYDFSLFKEDKLIALIEYDGKLHFKKTTLGNDLEYCKIHDNIKTEYAKNINIPLLRIPYTEYKRIDTILNKFIKGLE